MINREAVGDGERKAPPQLRRLNSHRTMPFSSPSDKLSPLSQKLVGADRVKGLQPRSIRGVLAAGRKLETSAGGATDDCKTSSRLQEEAIVSDIFTVTEDDELSGSRLDSPLVMCRVSLCETSSSKSLEKNLDSRFSEHDEVDSDADYEMAMDDMPSSPTKIASPGSMLSAVEPGGGGLVQ